MKSAQIIDDLIKATIHRAIRESIAGVLMILACVHQLQRMPVGTAQSYGCLLILTATPFILGVVWSHTLSYRLLRSHAASDGSFWQEAFRVQSRLLRLVPIWYLAPLCAGALLVFASGQAESLALLAARIFVVATLFAGVTWLNRAAADKMEERAAAFLP